MLKSTLRFRSDRDPDRRDDSNGDDETSVGAVIGTYLDTLDLSTAIIADDVVLEESAEDGLVLHRVVDCRAHRLGSFRGALDAWAAIDELDDIRAGRRGA